MKTELSDSEWILMKKLWQAAPQTITQLTAALKGETGWSKHTIITMLARLEAKKAVAYQQGRRAKEYYPVLLQEDASRIETRHFLDKVYDGNFGVMVNAMIDSRALTPEDFAELAAILEKAKGENLP